MPRTHIPPHTGVTNTRLTVHLPLIVPPNCGFRVGSETREWVPGKAWVFDDTIEHEAWNRSDAPRAVLIFDIWNPILTAAERDLVRAATEVVGRVLRPQRRGGAAVRTRPGGGRTAGWIVAATLRQQRCRAGRPRVRTAKRAARLRRHRADRRPAACYDQLAGRAPSAATAPVRGTPGGSAPPPAPAAATAARGARRVGGSVRALCARTPGAPALRRT